MLRLVEDSEEEKEPEQQQEAKIRKTPVSSRTASVRFTTHTLETLCECENK